MFFGNSDPTFFALFTFTSARKGQDPTHTFKMLYADFKQHLVIPVQASVRTWAKRFFRKNVKMQKSALPEHTRRQRSLRMQSADFELLAAYPVDRANPPAQQRLRFLTVRQQLLHGKLQSGTIHLRPEPVEWEQPQEIIFFEAEHARCEAESVLAEKN